SNTGALPGETLALGSLIGNYFADVRARQDRGELSRTAFKYKSKLLFDFAAQHSTTPADKIGPAEIDDYLASKPWGPNLSACFVVELRTAYRWGKRRRLIDCPPPEASRRMGRKTKRDKIPTPEEMDKVIAAI